MKKWSMANGTATKKATEELYEKEIRLYEDEYSKYFITGMNRFFFNLMKKKKTRDKMMGLGEKLSPGVYGLLACRSKYMDDVIEKAIEEGFSQIVNLGAGFDTRIFRLKTKNTPYFMMDLPEVMEEFEKRTNKNKLTIPENLKLVPIDFNVMSIEEALDKAGFDKNKRTIFIWEGVTQYISKEAVNGTFDFVSKSASGSRLAFSYVINDVFEHPENHPKLKIILDSAKKLKMPWISGFDSNELNDYVNGFDMEIISDICKDYYLKEYTELIGRKLEIGDIERIAIAIVK